MVSTTLAERKSRRHKLVAAYRALDGLFPFLHHQRPKPSWSNVATMESIILAERKRRRHKLVATYRALDGLDSCLSPADLEKVGIRQIPMTLEGVDCPTFFAPYKSAVEKPDTDSDDDIPFEEFEEFEQDPFYNAYDHATYLSEFFNHCILPDDESEPAGAEYSDWGDFGFGNLFELTGDSRWRVKMTWHMPESDVPHIVVTMVSEMAEGQALFHGEIKTAIGIMHRRLKTSALRQHIIAPVLIFSVIREHCLRVIEAYHDGEQLVMRTTPLVDLREADDDLFIKLSRWCLGGPSSKPTTPT
ncbi:hypothetical protein BJX63DRAFT_377399 [Aspergillus granulosus]|uniref:Uncharacterized protein n=1 Tax=Aspergillus granulosus TaxID=176169 RepID=A0ABR4I2C0_9EURO